MSGSAPASKRTCTRFRLPVCTAMYNGDIILWIAGQDPQSEMSRHTPSTPAPSSSNFSTTGRTSSSEAPSPTISPLSFHCLHALTAKVSAVSLLLQLSGSPTSCCKRQWSTQFGSTGKPVEHRTSIASSRRRSFSESNKIQFFSEVVLGSCRMKNNATPGTTSAAAND